MQQENKAADQLGNYPLSLWFCFMDGAILMLSNNYLDKIF